MADTTEEQAAREAALKQAVDAAVAAAKAPLEARIAELSSATATAERDQAIADAVAAAVAERDTELATVRTELDAAVAAQTAAEGKLTATMAYLEGEHTVAETARLTDERKAQVEALGIFASKPEHIDTNLERWVAQDAEEWAATFEGFEIMAKASGTIVPKPLPGAATAIGGGAAPATDASATRATKDVMTRAAMGAPIASLS